MNAKYNVMFWINVLITIEVTLQYNHIDHSHEILMTNDVGGGKKLGFTKKSLLVFLSTLIGWYAGGYMVKI